MFSAARVRAPVVLSTASFQAVGQLAHLRQLRSGSLFSLGTLVQRAQSLIDVRDAGIGALVVGASDRLSVPC